MSGDGEQVYETIEDEVGLPSSLRKAATKLPLVSKLLEDAKICSNNAADKLTTIALIPALEDCKVQATQLLKLFQKVMPDEGDSRWDRYVKAARTIRNGSRVESLVGRILKDLQFLATRFPKVTTPNGNDQLADAIEELTQKGPSLPNGFEQTPAYVHYGSGALNNNTGDGIQYNNNSTGYQNNGPGQLFVGSSHIVNNYPIIKKVAVDESENNISSKRKCELHFLVLYARNPTFTLRDVVAQEIAKLLAQRIVDEQIRIAIHGLGGAGKTQVALNIAYTHKRVCNVYWVNGDSIESFMARYTAIAQLIPLEMQGLKPDEICLAVKTWLESEGSGDWLLCADNADQLTDIYVGSINSYLPICKGVILFTSRDGSISSKLVHPGFCVELDAAMTEKEATTTFKSALGEAPFANADVDHIVRRLEYLPLAITQAAAYIRQNYISIDRYLIALEKSEAKLLAEPLRETNQIPRAVMTTWRVSYDYIRSQNKLATDLLDVMSYLDFQEVQRTLVRWSRLTIKVDDIDFDKAMGLLQSFALISPTASFSSYRVHRLVSLWTRQNVESKSETIRTALEIVSTIFEEYTIEKLLQYEVWLPHAETVLQHATAINKLEDDRTILLLQTARFHEDTGQWSKAEQYYRKCLSFYNIRFGMECPSTIDMVNNIANVYSTQGRDDEALEWYGRALAGFEKALGKEHSLTLDTVNNIAVVYSNQGRYDEALEWYGRALAGKEMALGKEHSSTLDTVNNIAVIQSSRSQREALE